MNKKENMRNPSEISGGTRGEPRVRMVWLIALGMLVAQCAHAEIAQEALKLPVKNDSGIAVESALDPLNAVWNDVKETPLHLNRTPPLYDGDPLDDNARPALSIRLMRTQTNDLIARAHWSDATPELAGNAPRYSAGGGESHIYHAHTENTKLFSDAFCIMVPLERGPLPQYPPMMMGDINQPVELHYWRAGGEHQILSGHGRATTGQKAAPGKGMAVREGDGWSVTMLIPNAIPGTPLCFAVWEGAKEQRDGLKYFSLWYEVD